MNPEEIEKVIKYDDYTVAVVSKKELPELHLRLGISPTPRHFYGKIPKDEEILKWIREARNEN